MPADIAWDTGDVTAEEALARAREHATSFAGSDVLQFIRRKHELRRLLLDGAETRLAVGVKRPTQEIFEKLDEVRFPVWRAFQPECLPPPCGMAFVDEVVVRIAA